MAESGSDKTFVITSFASGSLYVRLFAAGNGVKSISGGACSTRKQAITGSPGKRGRY
ncbi:uncharacterized protein RSE6_05129 [Rhynchosporium secalis]|uniref:Uncharacterized protein n=1 Tax=Rhynchosporium secalis TaxID=38038 RepID=A0A1E1M718_RHYSE|nr:uncharacterized protein RSE6_05129 [Rhynchosporium secalis]